MDPTPRERDQFSKNPKPRECEATLECETTLNTRRVGSSCRRDERGKMGDEVVFFTKYDIRMEFGKCRSRRELNSLTLYM